MDHTDHPFLAADVGGTHARLALACLRDGRVELHGYTNYDCADFSSLAAILSDYLGKHHGARIDTGVIACAGYELDGAWLNTNLPWPLPLAPTRAESGLRALDFINDFEAAAWATLHVRGDDLLQLHRTPAAPQGAVLVLGPGTGLGASVRVPTRGGNVVLATEAGHATLAPHDELEAELLRIARRDTDHVHNEYLLSGPGLPRLYRALGTLRGAATPLQDAVAITQAALRGNDAHARETLDVFCAMLGGVAGDLVLTLGARGGAYLAGGILPRISGILEASRFLDRYLAKGTLRPFLEKVPAFLIRDDRFGVLGAATWYVEHSRTAR